MPPFILSSEPADRRPAAATPLAVPILAALWLAFACGLPLLQLREARQRAHRELERVLTTDRPDAARVLAAFNHSNEQLDAAASGPCLLLAFTTIVLVNQLLRAKRRYHALLRELATSHPRRLRADGTPEH